LEGAGLSVGQDSGADRQDLIPCRKMPRRLDQRGSFNLLTELLHGPERLDYEMGQAIGMMRKIRSKIVSITRKISLICRKAGQGCRSLRRSTGGIRLELEIWDLAYITLLGPSIG